MEQDVAAALEAEALSYQGQSKNECRLHRELGAAEAHPMIQLMNGSHTHTHTHRESRRQFLKLEVSLLLPGIAEGWGTHRLMQITPLQRCSKDAVQIEPFGTHVDAKHAMWGSTHITAGESNNNSLAKSDCPPCCLQSVYADVPLIADFWADLSLQRDKTDVGG